jgi:hypothetical protein
MRQARQWWILVRHKDGELLTSLIRHSNCRKYQEVPMHIYKFKKAIYAVTVAALAITSATIASAQSAKAPASISRGPAPTIDDSKEVLIKYVSSLNASEKIEFYRSLSRQAMARAAEAKRLGNIEGASLYQRAASQFEKAAGLVQEQQQKQRDTQKRAADELSVRTKNCVPAAGKCVPLDSFVYIKIQENGQPWDKRAHYSKDGCETSAYQGQSCQGMLAREAWRLNYSFVP